MARFNLDEVDAKIIQSLQRDSRLPLTDLARLAGVSIPTVRARIERLKALGVVKQFTTVVDAERFVEGMCAIINVKITLPEMESVAKTLSSMDEVTEVYMTTGEYDLVLKVYVPDTRSLQDFILQKLSKTKGVERSYNSIVIGIAKEHYGPIVRPGFGIRLFCNYCKSGVRGEPVRKTIERKEYYFCCPTCASSFERVLSRQSS